MSLRGYSKRQVAVAVAFLVVLAACDWAQFGDAPNRDRSSADTGIALKNVPGLVLKWTSSTGGAVESSPAVVGNAVFVGSDDGSVYSYDAATGAKLWSFPTSGPVLSSPAVDKGVVYVGSDDHTLYALRADTGARVWSVPVDFSFAGVASAPAVANGVVYVVSAHAVYAYNEADGRQLWGVLLASTGPVSGPAVANGLAYVESYADATIWALRVDTGGQAWSATVPGPRASCPQVAPSPAVAGNVLYVSLCPAAATPATSLFAYQGDTGAAKWAQGNAMATTSPAVTRQVVYVGSVPAHTIEAHAVGDGSLLWTGTTGGAVASSPAVANGVLYVGSDDHHVYGFDAAGNSGCSGTPRTCTPQGIFPTFGSVRSSPAVANGWVYVGAEDHVLYAFSVPPISFGKSVLQGASSTNPTVARFGPDGRLYVVQLDGLIKAYTVTRNGPNAYNVTATETINLIQQIPNHNDDGTLNTSVTTRLITGLLVVGSASSPVLYVSSSDPRVGGGPFRIVSTRIVTNLDTNSGMISRLTRSGSAWQRQDLVRGLPRSEEDHATNTLVLDPATNILYVAQGGNTNLGAPSAYFNDLPEYAYSGAILTVDLNAIGNTTYDLPTLVDDNPNITGVFGGHYGNHQAKITPSSPVQVYAPGFRSPFSLVKTQAGKLFAFDNGADVNYGGVPINPGPGGTCTNAVNEGGDDEDDSLHLITGPGYYAGHANPTRGNRANTFNTMNPQSPVPVANPVECDPRVPASNGSILQLPYPTTGMAEYQASNFANQMSGDLVVAGYNNNLTWIHLNTTGDGVASTQVLDPALGTHPVDVAIQGDRDAFPGTIWVPDIADGAIYVFEPNG